MTTRKVGRDEPCCYGSGMKYKKRCMNKHKERKNMLIIDLGKRTKVNGVGITENGQIELIQNCQPLDISKSYFQTIYKRSKGPKVLTRVEVSNDYVSINLNRILLKYSIIFSIDTNTKVINGEKISVAGVVLCNLSPTEEIIIAQYSPLNCLEFRNIEDNHEKVAWQRFIGMLVSHPLYDESLSYGIVVDAYLGDILEYNKHNKPILKDFFSTPEYRNDLCKR